MSLLECLRDTAATRQLSKACFFVVSVNPTDPSFYPRPDPKNFMDFILEPKIFGFNFHRGLAASSSCIMFGSSFH